MTLAAAWPGAGSLGLRRSSWHTRRSDAMLVGVSVEPTGDVWARTSGPAWIEDVLNRLAEMRTLPRGWDGQDGVRATMSAIVAAITVLSETMATNTVPPAIVPTSNGGLQLEWHKNGVDLEVYVDANGHVSAWCQEGAREWEEDYFPRTRLTKELSRLTTSSHE